MRETNSAPAIPLNELRAAYEALGELPTFPGETTWVDRLRSFDDFLERGPSVADWFHLNPRNAPTMARIAPELHALLMRAFPR